MMPATYNQRQYLSAHGRLFDSVLERFLKEHVPQIGGPELRKVLIQKIIELFETYSPQTPYLQPGQMLWVAVDKNTRADSKKARFKPVVLTLITHDEINALANSTQKISRLLPSVVARLCTEAYEQGTLLSMRDIGLIFKRYSPDISALRKTYEQKHRTILPTPATLQDMGSGVTHKAMILEKILLEKKDMATVRNETCHTQSAIDRYLKDYRRIEILLDDNKDFLTISRITQIPVYVIKQYAEIYKQTKT